MDDTAFAVVACALTFSASVYVAVIFHELGHALAALVVGFPVTSVGIGLARPLFVVPVAGIRFYCCLHRADVGYTFVEYPSFTVSRRKLLQFLAGGVAANLALALVGILGFCYLPGGLYWGVFAAANALAVLINATPLAAMAGNIPTETDGTLWVRAWRNEAASGLSVLRTCRELRPLWQAVGDRRAEASFLVAVAQLWHELGDVEHARTLVAEARALLPELPFVANVTARLLDAAAHEDAGELAEAEAIYQEHDAKLRAAKDGIGTGTVSCRRLALAASRGAVTAAELLLPSPDECAMLAGFPEFLMPVLFASLRMPPSELNHARINRLRAMLETGRHSPEVTWQYHRRLTEHFIAALEYEQAETAALAAWQAALAVHALLGPDDQPRFQKCLQPFQEGARQLLHGRSRAAEGDRIADYFTNQGVETRQAVAAQVQGAANQAREAVEWKRLRIALALTAFNAVTFIAGILVLQVVGYAHTGWSIWAMLTILTQVPFLAGSLFYALLYALKRLGTRGSNVTPPPGILRESPGTMMLALTTMPWIVAALLWGIGLVVRVTGL